MNRADILEKLRALPWEPGDYWVITGAAMVLYGLRERTHDIDLGCTSKLADALEAEGLPCRVMEDGNRWFQPEDSVEVFENWIYDRIVSVDGLPVLSLEGLLEMKRSLGREKDRRDIRLLLDALGHKEETLTLGERGVGL
ncbi:MAG: hypothetical protein IJK24_05690 [Oscillospiraceae bacterium]|jgi:hypothetical protein|nr:hypothetical protein [Oscillospiraceae bacterium]